MRLVRVFSIIVIIFAVACGGGKSPKDRLVVAIETNPTTFDPRLAVDAYSMKIDQLLFNGLMRLDDRFNVVPDLASRYEQLNETTYKFYLKEGIFFHSGQPLTADDVVYTFQTILDGSVPSPLKSTFSYVKEVTKEADNIVVVELKEPSAPFLLSMTKGIVSKKDAEKFGKDFGMNPVGTGPYKFIEFKSDSHVLLAVNEKYYGTKPLLPFLEFKVLKDDNVRVLQLMNGNVDLAQNVVPPVLLGMLGKKSNLVVEAAPSTVFDYVGMNMTDNVLSNLDVRRALAHAINRKEIIKHKWEGYARVADTLFSPSHWVFKGDVRKYEYDPALAAKLLDKAGYPDPDGNGPLTRFKLSYKTSTQKLRIDIANLIAEQLRQIGVGVTVTPYEWGTFFRDVNNGNFQIYSLAWIGVTEPDIYYNIFNSTQFPPIGANRNRYVNKKIDELTILGRRTLGEDERIKIYGEIQDIVSEELPYIPLWYEDVVVVRQKNVKGYIARPDTSFQGVVTVTKE